MAYHSDFNYIGNYDYQKQAGLLHIADHHISPGKKQWTWGNGDFGRALDRNLTDENGPYIELMTGIFTDNQPDFTFLKPYEEKTFVQYFMPYKAVGRISNASTDVIVNMAICSKFIDLICYTSSGIDADFEITADGERIYVGLLDLVTDKVSKTSVHCDRVEK